MIRQKLSSLKNNQKGVVTFFIVIIIMLLLTLITIAMVRNANREERQALDRQLNTQAYYAAESGIRDVYHFITNDDDAPARVTECDDFTITTESERNLSEDGSITYSCALYDRFPENIVIDDIQEDQGNTFRLCRTAQFSESCDAPGGSVTITWNPSEASSVGNCRGSANAGSLPTKSDWQGCNVGIIRANFMDGSNLSRNSLIQDGNNRVKFLVPVTSGVSSTSTPYGGQNGSIVPARCTGDSCSVTINGVPNDDMFINLRAIYNDSSNVNMTVPGGDTRFARAQVEIDVTGQASDVLHRLQVRIPLEENANRLVPHFSIQTEDDSICKRLKVIRPTPRISANVNENC